MTSGQSRTNKSLLPTTSFAPPNRGAVFREDSSARIQAETTKRYCVSGLRWPIYHVAWILSQGSVEHNHNEINDHPPRSTGSSSRKFLGTGSRLRPNRCSGDRSAHLSRPSRRRTHRNSPPLLTSHRSCRYQAHCPASARQSFPQTS